MNPPTDRERQEEPHRGTRTAAVQAAREEAAARRRDAGRITPAIRKAVVGRKHNCPGCGGWFRKLTLDHVVPVARGGKTTVENAAPLCRRCNSSKGSMLGGPPRTCRGCQRIYRRARGGEDGFCDDCRRKRRARARREEEARIRKKASEWKRLKALEARRAWRARR